MNVISVDPGITQTGLYLYRGGGSSLCIQRAHGQGRYEYLRDLRQALLRLAQEMDLALVEDYVYSQRTPGGGRDSIEAGAVVRETFAEMELPIVLVQPAMWKSLTVGKLVKHGAGWERAYREWIRDNFGGVWFDTIDEADAFLIYQAVLRVWTQGGRTPAQRRMRDEVREVAEEKAEMMIKELEGAGFRAVISPVWSNGWTRSGSWIRETK